jgi:hypothetical protein
VSETSNGKVPHAGGSADRQAGSAAECGVQLEVGDGTAVTISGLPRALGEIVLPAEPLRHGLGNAATSGIWRVRGTAGSAVLKVTRLPTAADTPKAWPTSDDPAHWNYWRREALAYETGLAATAYAGAGITAPALLETRTRPDGGVEVWMADAGGTEGFGWPVSRLARFAYELGAAQARWAGRVPDAPWLSRRWLARYLAEGMAPMVSIDAADWDHPSVAAWPVKVRRRLRQLWTDRDRVVAITESAERTLSHLDVWPANLVDDAGTSVLLDWSFTGDGAVGEDVANLIVDSFTDGLMGVALLPELADRATDGYINGLRDGGWSGSADSVRTAIALCGAAKYSWFAPAFIVRAIRDELGNGSYGQDASAAAAISRLTGLVTLLADWADAGRGRVRADRGGAVQSAAPPGAAVGGPPLQPGP